MNYSRHYNLLIDRSRTRTIEGYTEKHHVIPRCLGGTDDDQNIVDLTPEEHYLAHQLLVKIYPNHGRLVFAAQMMTIHPDGRRNNNKLFGWLRRRLSKSASEERIEWYKNNEHPKGFAGKTHSFESRMKCSNTLVETMTSLKGKKVFTYTLDGEFYKEYPSLSRCARDIGSSAINVKTAAEGVHGQVKGYQIRYEFVESLPKYKNPNKEKVYEKVTCPHCNKEGGGPTMKRYHFDNCKFK